MSKMKFSEYQEMTARTSGKHDTFKDELLDWGLGVAGEAGEVADYIKKCVFQGHMLEKEKLRKEIGDVLWYLARLSECIDSSLEEVATINILKLKERYPNGFNELNSVFRKDE